MKNQPLTRRLGYAARGVRHAFRCESSFRSQLAVGIASIVVLAILRPPILWVALCLLAASLVLALELMNTALEHVVDKLHPEVHAAIEVAKDCAAGAVLVASIVALAIGILTVSVALGWIRHSS